MPERGGATTQSGILYQNTIAALFLGDLLNDSAVPDQQRVIKVRVEAPEEVDDTVVTFADDHRVFIQAKEHVQVGDPAWTKAMRDFAKQFYAPTFQHGHDRLRLCVGTLHDDHGFLGAACDRARASDNEQEWRSRLSARQQTLVQRVIDCLHDPQLLVGDTLWDFFRHIEVNQDPLSFLEQREMPHRVPRSNHPQHTLFGLLRDQVGGMARHRGSFMSDVLRKTLRTIHQIEFAASPDLEALRQGFNSCGAILRSYPTTLGRHGRHIERPVVDDIIRWIETPTEDNAIAMVLDHAGMGKTVIMHDLLVRLEAQAFPVLAIKADVHLAALTSQQDVQHTLGLPAPVDQIVKRLATRNMVVVLVDQLDALSLTLARNEQSLTLAFDLIHRLRTIPSVKLVLSCRTFDFRSDPRLRQLNVTTEFPVLPLSNEDVDAALQDICIARETLTPATQTLLQTPLHLDLFTRLAEDAPADFQTGHSITTLQDLYTLLWRHVVRKPGNDFPPEAERVAVIRRIIERMHRDQEISVPDAMFDSPETVQLRAAVQWLTSMGILVEAGTTLEFLHQTFFDYCYAKQFVEGDTSLLQSIQHSDQGLTSRPHIVHVLAYLRGTIPSRYIRELNTLFRADLRFHIRDLIFNWFGAVAVPTDTEWSLAQRLLGDPILRSPLLLAMHGKQGWFMRLQGGFLRGLLAQNDATLNGEVLLYLDSLSDSAQRDVCTILQPYVGHSEEYNHRVIGLLSNIRHWHTAEACDLAETVIRQIPVAAQYLRHEIKKIAAFSLDHGLRIIHELFTQKLHQFLEQRALLPPEESPLYGQSSLLSELESLNDSALAETITRIADLEPHVFLNQMTPWVRQAVEHSALAERDLFFPDDDLDRAFDQDASDVTSVLLQALMDALIRLARTAHASFHSFVLELGTLGCITPQRLLARIYREIADDYASEALQFLLGDQRRLMLGDPDQYDSRMLIQALMPHLSEIQQRDLIQYILDFRPIRINRGRYDYKWQGIEQLYLLQAVPESYLSPQGRRSRDELERRFPTAMARNTRSMEVVTIGPPISIEQARHMTNGQWLRAIAHYEGDVRHRLFGKGGKDELSGVLSALVKEDPDRFFAFLPEVPETVDTSYIQGFINGFAHPEAPATQFYSVINRFMHHPESRVLRTIAWAVEKRADDHVPREIVDFFEQLVRGDPFEDEESTSSYRDIYTTCINCVRGIAFKTLVKVLDYRGTDHDREHIWNLIEFATTNDSLVLRAAAITVLEHRIHTDRPRGITLFIQLMNHPALFHSYHTGETIYYGMYRQFERTQPLILEMMEHSNEEIQKRGAELACIAYISPNSLETPALEVETEALARQAIEGATIHRRGAARIYAYNALRGASERCFQALHQLLQDSDDVVLRSVSSVISSLRGEHLHTKRAFLESYAASPALSHGLKELADFLLNYGLYDTSWTLSIILLILDNPIQYNAWHWTGGAETLIRLVARIYNDQMSTPDLRVEAMNIFDRLMARFAHPARKVLEEWDRR